MTFNESKKGWAVGHCGTLLKADNGKKWKQLPFINNNRLRSIAFTNAQEGYIAGDSNRKPGVLYKSMDGGNTWIVQMKNTPDLHHLTLTKNKIWVVGKAGTVYSKSY